MSLLSNIIFHASYRALGRRETVLYKQFLESDKLSFDELRYRQDRQLCRLVEHCYNNVPYYTRKLKELSISPMDIKGQEDLNLLPVLTKAEVLNNLSDFTPNVVPKDAVKASTGGSTGEPMRYMMSNEDRSRGVALMYRGWSRAGYKLGDHVFIFAGSSLVGNPTLFRELTKWSRNFSAFSSFGVSELNLIDMVKFLNRRRPKFLRGYASSIALLANFIATDSKYKLNYAPNAIFTTAEMLTENQRSKIEQAFSSKVFNQYGLNDGGISAYEDRQHTGFLIDTERSIMESVDSAGKHVLNSPGSLLATSLHNFAFPFIRYDTGDVGIISRDSAVSENRMILKNLLGRSTDFIEVNNRIIGSPVLTVLMGKFDIKRYQIVQSKNKLKFLINKGASFTEADEKFILTSIIEHLGNVEIEFDYKPQFIETKNKHKFIVNLKEI